MKRSRVPLGRHAKSTFALASASDAYPAKFSANSFRDICAYPDGAFMEYWRKVLADPHFQALLDSLGKLPFFRGESGGAKPGILNGRGANAVRSIVSRLKSVRSAVDFHALMSSIVNQIIERTTDGLSVSGVEDLPVNEPGTGICFLSSHRSTFLDPAIANLVLQRHHGRKAHNAAGDNIFRTPWLGHLVRLNRGFVVKRQVEGIDEKLEEARKLSAYIRAITAGGGWVWIAHRNGRAKNGEDLTDSAVPAMLKLASTDESWYEFTSRTAHVPVAMSWELVPLDDLMAQELNGISAHSGAHRDMMNIVKEIRIPKKRVHIHFGTRVTGAKRSDLVRGIDREILLGTRLWSANWAAYIRTLEETDPAAAAETGRLVSAHLNLDSARWLFERVEQVRADVLRKLDSGELERSEAVSNPDADSDSRGPAHSALADGVAATLLSMYAAPVRLALAEAGSVHDLLARQNELGFLR